MNTTKKKLTLVQAFRRMGQQLTWHKNKFDMLSAQLPLIKKVFDKNGLRLVLTCGAMPEQYDVFKGSEQVAYLRLRHGYFSVEYPDCGGQLLYEAEPMGDGVFEDEERALYLCRAKAAIIKHLTPPPTL